VEEDKPETERGYYLHPELFGPSERESVNYAHYPELVERALPRNDNEALPR